MIQIAFKIFMQRKERQNLHNYQPSDKPHQSKALNDTLPCVSPLIDKLSSMHLIIFL